MKNLSKQLSLKIDETSIDRGYWNSIAVKEGFRNIEDFSEYFDIHSKTPRALFSGRNAELVLALAGYSKQKRESLNPHNFFIVLSEPLIYKKMKRKITSLN